MTTTGPTTEVGHAQGVASTAGIPFDPGEWTPELSWPLNIAVYDRMRRQDAQVKSILNAVSLPIRRTPWRVNPNGAPPEVVQTIADDLGLPVLGAKEPYSRPRDRGRFSWAKHVRVALLSLPYGHLPCEIAGDIMDDGLWHLTGLPERLPPTIAKINTKRNGDLVSIEQYPSGLPNDAGPFDVIEASRLVMYCHEREGGLWQGNSILRTAYKNWLIKDRLIRVDAMKHDRNGLGVPNFEAPPNASETVMRQLQEIASAFRAGDTAGLSYPAGAKFNLTGVTGALPDTLASIKYHDEQIAREALAQFLELVTSSHGSRALATSFIDFFLMSLQAVADELAEAANEQLIEEWVDWNWGSNVAAPKIEIDEIGNQTALTAEAISALVTSGALVADESVDSYIRENFRLPERGGALNPTPPQQETPPGAPPLAVVARRRHPFHASSPGNTEAAPDWPGRVYLRDLVGHYAELVEAELAALIPSTMSLVESVSAAGADPAEHVRALSVDTSGLDTLLREMYGDAWLVGYHAGELSIEKAGGAPRQVAWASSIDTAVPSAVDWDAWVPGSPDAAALAAASADGSTGLARLLVDAGVTIRGIEGTTLDTLGNTLAASLARGDSVATAAADLDVILNNRARAEIIAQTEMARAMTAATLDSYRENAIEAREWLLSDGACPLCEENADAGVVLLSDDFPNGDAPVHPSCVCAEAPVVTSST